MKYIFVLLICYFHTFNIAAQSTITGDWSGTLQGVGLNLVFHIQENNLILSSTMDSPDQGAQGIRTSATTFRDSILEINIPLLGAAYKGRLANNEIKGVFTQQGEAFDLTLKKGTIQRQRPQEPQPPYPYRTEEVSFTNNQANITLSGTLTLPDKPGSFPAVILISGSGPQNRDEEIMGHKPFLVIADYLTRNGIAVLRFDDRGTAKSTGTYNTANVTDFRTDVEAGLAYLKSRKEIQSRKIGLIGHSEGGMIAPMIASQDRSVAFLILLAAPGVSGSDLILQQTADILRARGISETDIQQSLEINKKIYHLSDSLPSSEKESALTAFYLKEVLPQTKEELTPAQQQEAARKFINQILHPEIQEILSYRPELYLSKVKCPVLALNGEKDLQVNASQNLTGIREALTKAGNKSFETLSLPGLNHLFQECTTGNIDEYARISQTFSPQVLSVMTEWIKKIR